MKGAQKLTEKLRSATSMFNLDRELSIATKK